jgi:hypothetical protein
MPSLLIATIRVSILVHNNFYAVIASLQIEEPELPIFSKFLSTYDAGDSVTLVLVVVHSSVTAYRVNLTMDYPTEYFFINPNTTDAVQLYKDGILQPNSTADIDDENGIVVFRTDSLASRQVFVPVLTLTVKNNVENAQSYTVPHYLEWYNLPYGLEGGRNYSASGEQIIPIKSFQLSMEYSTFDENTPGNMVQLQEYISVNVSVTIPEASQLLISINKTILLYFIDIREFLQ